MSLRSKLMLALLFTGLAAVVLIGGLAYMRVYYKVDSLRREQAAEHFHASVTAYLSKHGSWEAGAAAEPFRTFMRSRREQQGGAPAAAPAPSSAAEGAPPAPQPFERRGGPGRPDGPGGPPFHFILADQNYMVLLGAGNYRDGAPLPEEARADALPVVVDGRTLAYVSPQGVLTPSKQEREYLSAVRDALLLGAACATALALGLGLLLGNSLSRSLSKLTEAVLQRADVLLCQAKESGRNRVCFA